jgi:DeoR/GlpR family transcriptional regulator of sugar metabolism
VVAEALARRARSASDLTVVTTNLDAAVVLSRVDSLNVFNVGGTVDQNDRAQHGDWALSELRRLRTGVAVVSASGMTTEAGIFAASTAEAAVTTVAIENTGRVWVVIDAGAFGNPGFVQVAAAHRVEEVYVAGRPGDGTVTRFTGAGIQVIAEG